MVSHRPRLGATHGTEYTETMAHTPRSSAAQPPRATRPELDIPESISDIVMQEFAAFGDVVAKLTEATVLLEYNRERTEFYLLIGPSAEEEDGAKAAVPDTRGFPPTPLAVSTNQPTVPAPPPPSPHPQPPPIFTAFLHCPGVRTDN